MGASFGLARFVADLVLDDQSVVEAALTGVGGGLLFGLVLGPMVAAQNRRVRQTLGTDDPVVIRRAARAARRGPVPEDPTEREQARLLAESQVETFRRQRVLSSAAMAVLVVLSLVVAVMVDNVWAALPPLVLAAVLVAVRVRLLRRLEQRAELLQHPPG